MLPLSLNVTLGALVFFLYLMVGYYRFEVMALTATERERPFVGALSEGQTAARVVWLVYVLAWPLLHIAALLGLLRKYPAER